MQVAGDVTSGLGDGARYVGMDAYQERFEAAVGFTPFPGTLNLAMEPDEKRALRDAADHVRIDAFTVDGDRYSAVDAYHMLVEGEAAALLEMEITEHPPRIAEVIAPVNLRQELGLEDGDTVTCRPR
ncbi:MAG: DUF120 domain-containing protein [Candidatus Nanohaloarchaea archaeon]|nr:DUF120 domain-containing protein [Candidatus Nanohaloarchaea archaeon]